MTVGIIVPTLNRIRKTRRFIDCLEKQTHKDFRLYLVDSGSHDGTRDLPQEAPFPCSLISATLDDWWSACTNLGIKQAFADGCDVILTINDDSIIMPDYLESFLDVFEKNNLDVLANRIDFADEPGKIWALGSYSVWSSPYLFQLRFNGLWEDELPSEVMNLDYMPSMAVCGDGVLVRKSVYERIGYYNERFTPQVHGDSEFVMRAWSANIPVYVATKVVLYNDIYNLSEDKKEKVEAPKGFFKTLHELFFWQKSDLYWRPVTYVVWRYGIKGTILSTLAKFYLVKFATFFVGFFPNIAPRSASGKIENKSFLYRFMTRNALKLLNWASDFEKFENTTSSEIFKDRIMKRRVTSNFEKIHRELKLQESSIT